jgi:hypothetical protein
VEGALDRGLCARAQGAFLLTDHAVVEFAPDVVVQDGHQHDRVHLSLAEERVRAGGLREDGERKGREE